eukprot:20478-Heterococcus_DN1.PRE.1
MPSTTAAEEDGIPALGAAVSTLTHMTLLYTKAMAKDLRAFSRHGKRSTVNNDDVKLLARKSPELLSALEAYEKEHCATANKPKVKRKKAGTTATSTTAAAAAAGSSTTSSVRKGAAADDASSREGSDEEAFVTVPKVTASKSKKL